MRRVAVLASAVVACALLSLQAQEPPQQPTPTFRAGVDVVQLDVSVLDGDRRPVRGLTAADFTVLEDGVALPIVAFEEVDIPDASALPAPWIRDAAADVVTNDATARRIVVIVFDDAHMPLESAPMAMHIARDVVDQLGPNDMAAVAFTDSGPAQNVTSDRQLIRVAIDSLVPHPANSQPGLFSARRAASGSLASTLPRGGSPCYLRGKYRGPAACVIDTLVTAGDALRQAPPGRKTLVYISAGLPLDLAMTDLRGESNPGEVVLGVQAALRALQEANVTVYAMDPSGLTPDGIMAPRLESLRLFAEDTGGRATFGTNVPWEAVPQIFRENSSYYMLGIRALSTSNQGRLHRVHVKVNRPESEVRTRSGYYGPSPARTDGALSVSALDEAIGQPVPGGALPLALTLAPFAVPGERDAALAVLTSLQESLEASSRSVELAVMALDARCGECGKLPAERGRFTISASEAASRAEVLSRLTLPPGRYEIRVAATLDGRSGGVFMHVEIPDYRKDRLSASGLVLSTVNGVTTIRSDLIADLLPVVPTARREFRADARVSAFLRIYQGGSRAPGAVRVNATIRDAADRAVLDETMFMEGAQFAGSRSADYRLDLPIPTLDVGAYLLTIEAHLGDMRLQRQARFAVR